MCIKTREMRSYDSAADAQKDGFSDDGVRKCVTEYVSKRKDGSTAKSVSHLGWVWMSKDCATKELLEQKCEIAKRGKVRKERPVMGMNVLTKKVLKFRSSSEASRNGFNITNVYRSCGSVSVHRGFTWVFLDVEDPQSLLESKVLIILSKTRTGPKSWQI